MRGKESETRGIETGTTATETESGTETERRGIEKG